MDRERFVDACGSLGLDLSADQVVAYEAFEVKLYDANRVMNLTRVPQEECWLRHFLDSLLFHDLIPQGATVLDIGAGPGFPAWPLAVARPDLAVMALDSSSKMTDFLRSSVLPNLEVVQGRAEEWGVREQFDVVTGRAVAPLSLQLELSAPPCKVGGLVLPMRTPQEADSLKGAFLDRLGLGLEATVVRRLPVLDVDRLFPVYRKVKATPDRYPRRWAEMRKSPL